MRSTLPNCAHTNSMPGVAPRTFKRIDKAACGLECDLSRDGTRRHLQGPFRTVEKKNASGTRLSIFSGPI